MGFRIICRCDSCGKEEIVNVDKGESGDDFTFENHTVEDEEFSLENVAECYGFGYTFIGGSKHDICNYKFLCSKCRAKVQEIDKTFERAKQKEIFTILKKTITTFNKFY